MDDDLTQYAKAEIVGHMSARPDSADTVEGVHQWWIQWPDTAQSITVTLTALEQLEQAGFMQRQRLGNREIWRRRRPDWLDE